MQSSNALTASLSPAGQNVCSAITCTSTACFRSRCCSALNLREGGEAAIRYRLDKLRNDSTNSASAALLFRKSTRFID